MSLSSSFTVGFILLAFSAIAWLFIRYPAEKDLRIWHIENEEKRRAKKVSELNFYRTAPPSQPTRKSSYGFFIAITFLIGALVFFCKAFLVLIYRG